MTGTILRLISRQTLLSLLTVYLVSPAHLKLNERSTNEGLFDGPCFEKSGEGPTVLRSLAESIEDLKTRTSGLKIDAELLKDFLKAKHHISDDTARLLDVMNWMRPEDMVTEETDISEPKEAFKFHYHLLSIYRLYVKQVRMNGTLSVKKSEAETRKRLNSFERKISSCMCSLKIALQYSGSDVSSIVSSDILDDPNFMAHMSPLTNAIYRAYITMHDGITLMEFLHSSYQNVEDSLTGTRL